MENEETTINTPFLIIQKPHELIKLFENLIEKKLKQLGATSLPLPVTYSSTDPPFLSSREVEKIFMVSRQTVNDWRRTGQLQSFKIKSWQFFLTSMIKTNPDLKNKLQLYN
ncbi:MAG TPA: helix-turn-helix domain-containing protein [Puia sp.]|nr:helix-turn-helix domain-containing protein [Puia sp.]